MIKDWIFSDEQRICHFRVAGVLVRGDKLLVQSDNDNVFAIPGGHIAFGETSQSALIRELREEIGIDISVGRLIWVEEYFWKWGQKDAHGISFYYLVSPKDDADLPEDFKKQMKDNADIFLSWITFDEVKNATIYPEFIRDKIDNIPDYVEHFTKGFL